MFSLLKPKKCLLALLGSAILAFGLYNVHALSGVTEGGVLGMTLLLHHWFGISPAVTGLVLNAVCYWMGWRLLGKEFDISWKKLVKYNDLHREYTLQAGDIIYLMEKNKKAQEPHRVYVVKDGDSMHSISQKFGIRLKNLYKMNRKDADEYVPEVGDRLRLR